MLVLFDTPAGHALFKLLKPKALSKPEDLWENFTTLEGTNKLCAPPPALLVHTGACGCGGCSRSV